MRAIRSLRILGKHWKLALIAVFSLSIAMALGVIGLSITNTFLFLPLAAPQPDRLVTIYSHAPDEDIGQISYPDYQYFQANNHVFSDIAAAPNSISVTVETKYGKGNVKLISRPVSWNYFSVLGIRPILGRLLAPEDEQGQTHSALMTYSCWIRLGSDANIIGKKLSGNTIVGVLPKEYTGSLYGVDGDLMVSMTDGPPNWRTDHASRHVALTARLKPGVSRRQAQAEMATLMGHLATAYPKEEKDRTVIVIPAMLLPPDAIATTRIIMGVLMGAVLLVLLIACANVANLLLAIAVGRRQEAVIKLALGAQRSRLVREFLKESAVLCLASALAGYALAAFLIHRFSQVSVAVPTVGAVSFGTNLHLDGTVAAFTLGLMLIAILATGVAPALYASSPSLAQVLSGELAVGGTGKATRRNILVIVQVAVCTLVLVGMGLCERNLYNLRHVDPGFSARNLVAMSMFAENFDSLSEAQIKAKFAGVRDKVAALPGVESVTLASSLPLFGGEAEAVGLPGDAKTERVWHNAVDPSYFETFEIRLLSGRVFTKFDREDSPEVVIVNQKMAQTRWPGQDAVGKVVMLGDKPRRATVVGVVADGKYDSLDEAPKPFMYYPLSQSYHGYITIVARTSGDPSAWIVPMAQLMRSLNLTVLDPITYKHWMDFTLFFERYTAGGAAVLSGLGLLLAVIGLFGAISYAVSERRKELGIRVALGARPGQLLDMILRHTLLIAGTGVVIGVALGVGATMLLRSQFYGIAAVEWSVLIPVGAAMLAMSALVAYLSARPWLSIDPMEAVRHA